MPMHNPPHPGEIVRHECLEPLGLTVTQAAQGTGFPIDTKTHLLVDHGSGTQVVGKPTPGIGSRLTQ